MPPGKGVTVCACDRGSRGRSTVWYVMGFCTGACLLGRLLEGAHVACFREMALSDCRASSACKAGWGTSQSEGRQAVGQG